jgi:hypothetical protein
MKNLSPDSIFSMRQLLVLLAGSAAYFAWFGFLVGLRTEHIFLYLLMVGLYCANASTRRVVLAFVPFVIYWILYDSMRIMPNFEVNPVHVAEPYYFEKNWFGINTAEGRLTPNEYFITRHTPFWDIVTGLFYLTWIPVPLLFAFWLLRYNKPLFLKFSYSFLFVNIVGICIYYLYPAAPPWYVEQYGFEVIYDTPGNAAGLLNFDRLLSVHIFAGIYEKNASVFAAIPSLHSAFPVMCLLYGWRLRKNWLNVFFAVIVAGIWFAAVYSRHHYIIDVLIGGAVAVFSYLIFEFLSEKTVLKKWFTTLANKI